ncbi:MAG: TIGR03545 family protein, partial [Planctomycetota bacterium]
MIRWNFVFTRLIIVVLILVLMRWGLGPVAGFVTVRGLESATGARVEIAKTKIGLFPPRVQYFDVAVADPRDDKAFSNAFEADCIDLVIDGDALMHRRFVVSDGRVTGVKIGGQRDASGHYERVVEPESASGPSVLDGLLGSAAG